jgi:hypothetical protein
LIKKENVRAEHVYVFIILHDFDQTEEYFIVPGHEIIEIVDALFGSSYKNPEKPSKMPAINYGPLAKFKNNWIVFAK